MGLWSFHLLSLILHYFMYTSLLPFSSPKLVLVESVLFSTCSRHLFDPFHPPLSPVHQETLLKGNIIDVGTLETLATEYKNTNVSGLQWEEIDPAELAKGTEFTNDALSAALLDSLEFTPTELDELGATDLSWDNYVRVDEKARCVSQV
jgi:hypothetical protein